jgi:hypothetical protein
MLAMATMAIVPKASNMVTKISMLRSSLGNRS